MVTTGTQIGRFIEFYSTETAIRSLSDDDDDMVTKYSPACYLLNSRELNLRIRRSSRRKSPYAGSLILLSVKEHKFAEMSTGQQDLYVQVQVLQNCTRVQVYKYQVCI